MRALKSYTDIANCAIWFDSLGGLTLSGTDITAWADQSGAGIASPATLANGIADNVATAVAPTYVASDAAFDGKPSIVWGTGNAQTALPDATVCGRSSGAVDVRDVRQVRRNAEHEHQREDDVDGGSVDASERETDPDQQPFDECGEPWFFRKRSRHVQWRDRQHQS